MSKEYNGWGNYESWNVSRWLSEEPYCFEIISFMSNYGKERDPYKHFIVEAGLDTQNTPDKVAYMSKDLDLKALNDFMKEFAPQGARA